MCPHCKHPYTYYNGMPACKNPYCPSKNLFVPPPPKKDDEDED